MIYINRRTGSNVVLSNLDARQQEFYREAAAKFRKNVDWSEFEDFAFGAGSPLYVRRTSHLDVLDHPLYRALKDMWLELGVRQGLVAQDVIKEQKPYAQRRTQSRSRKAANRRDPQENSKLASAHPLTGTHS